VGQTIEILKTTAIDHMLVIETDRNLASQNGESYAGIDAAGRGTTFPAKLATRLFEADAGIDHVFVMSNTVSVRRPRGWDDVHVEVTRRVVGEFYRFYL